VLLNFKRKHGGARLVIRPKVGSCPVQFCFPLCIEPATIRDDSAVIHGTVSCGGGVIAGSSQSGHITCT